VRLITRPRWLPGTLVTEYFPVREAWFTGQAVAAPGLVTKHRVDWLDGAHGVAMNGEGIGLDGRVYHFTGPYDLSWVNEAGAATLPCWNGHWTRGEPAWYGNSGNPVRMSWPRCRFLRELRYPEVGREGCLVGRVGTRPVAIP